MCALYVSDCRETDSRGQSECTDSPAHHQHTLWPGPPGSTGQPDAVCPCARLHRGMLCFRTERFHSLSGAAGSDTSRAEGVCGLHPVRCPRLRYDTSLKKENKTQPYSLKMSRTRKYSFGPPAFNWYEVRVLIQLSGNSSTLVIREVLLWWRQTGKLTLWRH